MLVFDKQGSTEATGLCAVTPIEESSLGFSEEKFHLLVDSVVDYAIFMLDPQGYVISWNKGVQRIKGYSQSEILGKHFSTFYTESDIDAKHPEEVLRLATQNGRYEEEGWRVRKDGSRFWASVTVTAMYEEDGTLRGFAKVTRDMTERRAMEDQLRELNRQLESFAYSVSHDLRAPLRNMSFLSQVLLEDYGNQVDDEGRQMLKTLGASTAKLSKVISDLLALSKLSRTELKRQKIDLTRLAKEVWSQIIVKDPSRASCELVVDEKMKAFADRSLLEVILLNLLDNAVKFSPESCQIHIGSKMSDTGQVFFVQDHGIGFDMAYAHKVFLPFERLVNDDTVVGSGIGLANVQQAVIRMGGKVWIESELGKGTTVYFTLHTAYPA